jgi:hypothetical protein
MGKVLDRYCSRFRHSESNMESNIKDNFFNLKRGTKC